MVSINGSHRSGNVSDSKNTTGDKPEAKSGNKPDDRVRVADAAGLRDKAQGMLDNLLEVRMERIEDIRSRIERGDYNVSGREVAVRIVVNALAERPW